ncbi:MAG TPA: hypothetical protein VHC22_11155 [Pirellulales bacterium]|nr:hypothetical protein [Pirellulales bacterium]
MSSRDPRESSPEALSAVDELLGYLNLSAGSADVRFQRNLNQLAMLLAEVGGQAEPLWQAIRRTLHDRLATLRGTTAAFSDTEQAEAVIDLAFDRVLTDYSSFHRELLWHQRPENLFRPFFLARVCEAVLAQGGPWDEPERIGAGALKQLNSFIGHRPIAVLRTPRHAEPYPHEWVAPVPLYLRGAGVGVGPYRELVEAALAILQTTDADILEEAYFSPDLLDELAFDPRAYDFDHPVNKRPNYQFGQFDPHTIDNQGRYRRFVVQEITLAALDERIRSVTDLPREELLFEGAAVLAGTILMASGVSGRGPETHDSSVTLAKLVPRIAAYRDEYYRRLLVKVPGQQGDRLREEATARHQPLAGARQQLNQCLARLRAVQLQHVHLAQIFARMGYPEASTRQAEIVAVPSARLLCEISGKLTAGHHALDRGDVARAAASLPEVEHTLRDAIECGALIDPWNVLGFQGQFSLFPALENSVRDHRVDVLIQLVRQIFDLYARTWGEAAARQEQALSDQLSTGMNKLARWWDRFATLEVGGIEHVSGREAHESAAHVARALAAWRAAGAAAGDLAFWRGEVAAFDSPKAYALVVAALLEQGDLVASMALMMQWVARADEVALSEGDHSFHDLALRWFACAAKNDDTTPGAAAELWPLAKKFLDYLEANAEHFWDVPELELADRKGLAAAHEASPLDPEEGEDDLYRAAYDEMTYRDSTDDGYDADMLEGRGAASDFELDAEADRISKRLEFLITVARLWKRATGAAVAADEQLDKQATLRGWCARAGENFDRLKTLLSVVHRFPVPPPIGSQESLVEYDRRRFTKETLLGRIVIATVETCSARLWLSAALESAPSDRVLPEWERAAISVLHDMFLGDWRKVQQQFPQFLSTLEQQPILYIPLSRQGEPLQIVTAKTVQQLLHALLRGLVKLGLLTETGQLLAAAQTMERHRPAGEGAVTEFDRLFEAGFRGAAEALVAAATEANEEAAAAGKPPAVNDAELIEVLESASEPQLKAWLAHSRSLRLSVIERVTDDDRWQSLKEFIERYGREIFTPRFLNLGNLRAILHRGMDAYLTSIEDDPELAEEWPLVQDLGQRIERTMAVEQLSLAIEAIVENYAEFKDFNSTTTQSDRGDLLYVLLDLLRLKTGYDRVAWNIKPVVMVHELLARRGWPSAAELWRRGVAKRTAHIADWHLKRLAELNRNYGIKLPTISDRLGERFVRPLAIDRVRALICPAIDEARQGLTGQSFAALEQELAEFTETPSGSGLDVPAWLIALEEEVDRCQRRDERGGEAGDLDPPGPQLRLNWDAALRRLKGDEN